MAQSAVHTVHHQMHQKSYRIRSLQSENKRRERLENRNQQWEEDREERREIRRERNDSVGPLPGDPAPETAYRYIIVAAVNRRTQAHIEGDAMITMMTMTILS